MQAERKAALQTLISNLKASKDELDHNFADVANDIVADMDGDEDNYEEMVDISDDLDSAAEHLSDVIDLLEDILEA